MIRPREHPAWGADHPEQRKEDHQQQERGAKVIAEHHQQAKRRRSWQQRYQQHPPVGELAELLLPRKQVGAPQQERQLGELRRLELQPGNGDPARGPGDRLPDGEHEDQADQRGDHQRIGRGAEQPRRRLGEQPHHRQPDGHPEQLLGEYRVLRLVRVELRGRRGGEHHDESERQQQAGGPDEQVVRGERPVEGRGQSLDPSRWPVLAGPVLRGAQRAAASRQTASANAAPRAG